MFLTSSVSSGNQYRVNNLTSQLSRVFATSRDFLRELLEIF
jgi:hypothetical protein